ncbi:DUF5916 domain-containing protein [Pseudohongiella acticola]|jgi:Domain of unknown function (DUF5916)|uniref:DUF5916 domain-containing protein n=1 Tax=Pseudohongiella acticola TaxID=1524254 RepID=UPI0030EE8388
MPVLSVRALHHAPLFRIAGALRTLSIVLFSVSAVVTAPMASAQSAADVLQMPKIADDVADIELDGFLTESVWRDLTPFDGMRVINPDTLEPASLPTDSRIFYNDRGIYVGVMNFQPPETLVARMSSRDDGVQRDGYVISVDASGEGLYGYYMRINLGGTMSDGTILPEKQISRDWDGPWQAVTQELDNGWSAEIFIPWSMMALPDAGDTRQIGIYTERMLASENETWSWPALPNTNPEYLSAFQKFELQGVTPSTQFTFYPYASATYNNITGDSEGRVGADVYWRPNSNTQLSATLNPDFGTVESDDIVVNLGAFETFFSEKRTFFLEGQEVFTASPRASGGPFGPTTVLNTRRIGAAPDFDIPAGVETRTTERNTPTELLGAVKITGSQGNWRYGSLLASEDDTVIRGTAADGSRVNVQAQGRDFAIGRLLYEDTSGGGRRGIGWIGTRLQHADRDATVNGVDVAWFSRDTRWVFDGQLLHSDVDDETGKGGFFDLNYRPSRGIDHSITGTFLDDKLNINDVGYVQRNDHYVLDYRLSVTESGLTRYRSRQRSMSVINQWNGDGRPVRLGLFFGQNVTYQNNTSLNLNFRYFPPRVDDRLSRGNGTFKIPHRVAYDFTWRSDRSLPLSYSVGISNSEEDLGSNNINYSLGLEWQPNDRFSTGLEVDYRVRDSWLVHQGDNRLTAFTAVGWFPELNASYFINARQQFRVSMQWTGIKAQEDEFYLIDQTDVRHLNQVARPGWASGDFNVSQMSFQARYRWEIAPLSDLFVVYTRGSNLPRNAMGDYQDLLFDAWSERITDSVVIKLRYRLGS